MDNREKNETFLRELEDYARAEVSRLLALHLDPKKAARMGAIVAKKLCDFLALSFGGQQIYIRQPSEQRAERIYAEFTGENYAELALKYKISERQARNIIAAAQAARSLRQKSLLDFLEVKP